MKQSLKAQVLSLEDYIADDGTMKVTCTLHIDRFSTNELKELKELLKKDVSATVPSIFPLRLGECEIIQKGVK